MYVYIVYKETAIRKKRTSRVLLKLKERKKKCAIFLFSLSRWRWWWWKGKEVEERFYLTKKERNYLMNYTLSGISCSYTKLNIWKVKSYIYICMYHRLLYRIYEVNWLNRNIEDKEKRRRIISVLLFQQKPFVIRLWK